jgi:hypothetical protein
MCNFSLINMKYQHYSDNFSTLASQFWIILKPKSYILNRMGKIEDRGRREPRNIIFAVVSIKDG